MGVRGDLLGREIVFKEKGGEGDVRNYSEREAGLGGPGPSGEPFPEDEKRLARPLPQALAAIWGRTARLRRLCF
jgi:hypothetical protein